MVEGLYKKIYGNSVVFANLRRQRRIPYLPQEKLYALRDARLREMVKYAAATVPFYAQLFKKQKIDVRDIKTVDALERLPFIDRETVRKSPHLFTSTSKNGKSAISFVTSGSTGTPLTIMHDPYSLLANIAFGERERAIKRKALDGVQKYREMYISYPNSTIAKVWEFYKQWTFLPVRPGRLTMSVSDAIENIMAAIDRFRPHIIVGYGSYLETFYRFLRLQGLHIHRPRMLVYVADSMTSAGKKMIEQEFGVPVFSAYNAVEAFKIGYFCENRTGFHLHEDLCHVTIVDASGEKVPNGQKGEVVISNLVNHGTVLLNYRLGDIASLSDKKCSCGRTFRILSELEGRVEDVIFLSGNKFIHPRAVWEVFKGRNEVLQYQLIQVDRKRFKLKLVTLHKQAYQGIITSILEDLYQLIGERVTIEPAYCPISERQKTAKFRPVVSMCKQDGP